MNREEVTLLGFEIVAYATCSFKIIGSFEGC